MSAPLSRRTHPAPPKWSGWLWVTTTVCTRRIGIPADASRRLSSPNDASAGKPGIDDRRPALVLEHVAVDVPEAGHVDRQLAAQHAGGDLGDVVVRRLLLLPSRPLVHPRDATGDRPQPASSRSTATSRRSLPTLASASMTRWASATSSSGKRRSITGRRTPSVKSGSTSSAKRRLIAMRSSIGRPRRTVPTQCTRLASSCPRLTVDRAAAEQTDLDDASLRSHRGEVAVGLLAADHVEHDVDAVVAAVLGEPFAQRRRPVGR